MLKLRTEKQNKSGFFCVSILLQDKNAYLFEKAPKRGWNPSIQTNPMKNLKIYGNFLRHNWTFKCQIVNCSKNLYTFQFQLQKCIAVTNSNSNVKSNQILTVCKLILNQNQFDMIVDYWWKLMLFLLMIIKDGIVQWHHRLIVQNELEKWIMKLWNNKSRNHRGLQVLDQRCHQKDQYNLLLDLDLKLLGHKMVVLLIYREKIQYLLSLKVAVLLIYREITQYLLRLKVAVLLICRKKLQCLLIDKLIIIMTWRKKLKCLPKIMTQRKIWLLINLKKLHINFNLRMHQNKRLNIFRSQQLIQNHHQRAQNII